MSSDLFFGQERATPEILRFYHDVQKAWCAETCGPLLRARWSADRPSLGQCSVTAFLAQEIFGERVFGYPVNGYIHCYNEIDGCVYDFTSGQFGGQALCYEGNPEQFREEHFLREDKRQRYALLKARYQNSFTSTDCETR